MAAEEKAKDDAASAPPPASSEKSGGGGKLVLILTGVNVLATIGVLGIVALSFLKDKGSQRVEDLNPSAAPPAAEGEKGGEHGEKGAEGGHGEGGHGEGKKEEAGSKMITLEQFTVNLASVGSARPRFARVNISLEVPNSDTESEVNRKMPQVRNTIIDLFNSKRPTDLQTPEGRNYLKDEIRAAINSFLVTGKLKGVFFTGFAMGS
jgi:flagellar basal body-associated protein FliL